MAFKGPELVTIRLNPKALDKLSYPSGLRLAQLLVWAGDVVFIVFLSPSFVNFLFSCV